MPDLTDGGPPPPSGTTVVTIDQATIKAILLHWLHCTLAGGPWEITECPEDLTFNFEPADKASP